MGESMLINHYGSSFTPTSAMNMIPGSVSQPLPVCGSSLNNSMRHQPYQNSTTDDALAGFALEAINNHDWHNYYCAPTNSCSNSNVQNTAIVPPPMQQQGSQLSQMVQPPNLEPLKPKRKRYRRKPGDPPPQKRIRNPDNWTRVIKSKNYNTGKIKKLNGEIRARKVKGTCMDPMKCRIKCTQKISPSQQETLHQVFWQLGSFSKRREYLNSHVFRFEKNRTRSIYNIAKRNRQYTYKYFVTLNDERIPVCKAFFLNTFDVSDRMVHDGSTSMIIPGGRKPKRQPKDTPTEEQRNCARMHIKKYLISTVNRNPKVKTKEPHLTVSDMYRHYKNWFKERGYKDNSQVGKPIYRKIFIQGIKMGFHVMGPLPDRIERKPSDSTSTIPSTSNGTGHENDKIIDDSDGGGSDFDSNQFDQSSDAESVASHDIVTYTDSDDDFQIENNRKLANSKIRRQPKRVLRSCRKKATVSRKNNKTKATRTKKSACKNVPSVIETVANHIDDSSSLSNYVESIQNTADQPSSGNEPIDSNVNDNEIQTNQSLNNDDIDLDSTFSNPLENSQQITSSTSKKDRSLVYNLGMVRSSKGIVRPRKVRGICNAPEKCRQKCSTIIKPYQQNLINTNFWALGSLALRRSYLAAHINRYMKKTATCTPGTGQRERKFSYNYFFEVTEEKVQVCKSFFLNTLDISDRMAHDAYEIEAASKSPISEAKRTPVNKTKPESVDLVKTHIITFYLSKGPGNVVGNVSTNTNFGNSLGTDISNSGILNAKKDDSVNVTEMFRQYENWFGSCNYSEDLKVKQHMYRKIYHETLYTMGDKFPGVGNLKRPSVISIRSNSE